MKNQDGGEIWHVRLGFETVSWQHAAHTQLRSISTHAESFSRTPKSSKQKKGSASRVQFCLNWHKVAHTICLKEFRFFENSILVVPFSRSTIVAKFHKNNFFLEKEPQPREKLILFST